MFRIFANKTCQKMFTVKFMFLLSSYNYESLNYSCELVNRKTVNIANCGKWVPNVDSFFY